MGMFIQLNKEYVPINEIYFGNDSLLKAQKYLEEFRKEVFRMTAKKGYYKGIGLNENLLAFNREIEKVFGFEEFSLSIDPLVAIQNAYTLPISADITKAFKRDMVRKTASGYTFTKNAKVCEIVYVTLGLFLNRAISHKSLMALILHEIGHSFARFIDGTYATLNSVQLATQGIFNIYSIANLPKLAMYGILSTIEGTNAFRKFKIKIGEKLKNITNFVGIMGGLEYIIDLLIQSGLDEIRISDMNGIVINRIARLSGFSATAKSEVVSDSFATIYGYGPDLTKALNTMMYNPVPVFDNFKSAPKGLRFIISIYTMMLLCPILLVNPHPSTLDRMKLTASYLEKELEDSEMDPKMKKRVLKELEIIYEQIDDLHDIDNDMFYHVKKIETFIVDKFGKSPARFVADLFFAKTGKTYEAIDKKFNKIKLL